MELSSAHVLPVAVVAPSCPPQFHNGQQVRAMENGAPYQAVIRQTRWSTNAPSFSNADARGATTAMTDTVRNGAWQYQVHFLGWNARWDRWVDETSLSLPASSIEPPPHGSHPARSRSSLGARKRKKQKTESVSTTSSTSTSPSPDMLLRDYGDLLPLTLQIVLAEERERMIRRGWRSPHGYDTIHAPGDDAVANDEDATRLPPFPRLVHKLPSRVPIDKVLKQFAETIKQNYENNKTSKGGKHVNENIGKPSNELQDLNLALSVDDFCIHLTKLFDTLLPLCLLYPQERQQFNEILENGLPALVGKCDTKPSSACFTQIYGCEFLLRLLVRLPQLLSVVTVSMLSDDAQSCNKPTTPSVPLSQNALVWLVTCSSSPMHKHLQALIKLLQTNRRACFPADDYCYFYPKSSENYHS